MITSSPCSRRCVLAGAASAIVTLTMSNTPAPARERLLEAPLVIISGGRRIRFAVELAVSADERATGLMYRRSLARDRGMLFLFGAERVLSMWMKNTYVTLDMLFIARGGQIVSIHERAKPLSLEPIRSAGPASAVLELAGGTVARYGIAPGDLVEAPGIS